MVYGRLNTFKITFQTAALLAVSVFFASCQEVLETPSVGKRADALNGAFQNTGKGYVYKRNPIIASGNPNLSYPSMKDYVSGELVTTNAHLETPCFYDFDNGAQASTTSDCFKVLNDVDSPEVPLQSNNGGWNYPIGSDEFYQVNTFYHVNKMLKRFHGALSKAHANVHYQTGNLIPPATKYEMEDTQSFWLTESLRDPNDSSIILGVENSTLNVYSKCYLDPFNAYFSPAENKICLGWNEKKDWLYIAQDPSVIYHELGHALVKVMMNQRNVSYNFPSYHVTPYESALGHLFYDEGKAINEGVADWFSYFINGRTHFGEWALGRFSNASRAMTEDDGIHNGLVSKQTGERLSYPQFAYYNPNNPAENEEDSHYAGQIVSHYLVSLTEELKSCSSSSNPEVLHREAADMVLMLLNETFAEIGDMTGRGSDVFDQFRKNLPGNFLNQGAFFTNLNNQESYRWGHQVNPPNFRKFFQVFAKNIKYKIDIGGLCPSFSTDESESLLDEYGLLLFNNYGDLKKGTVFADLGSHTQASETDYKSYFDNEYFNCFLHNSFLPIDNFCPISFGTRVNDLNRSHSVLVSKDLLEFPVNREEVTPMYVLDGYSEIANFLATLTFEGKNVQVSEDSAGAKYNNDNIKISPGEVVGVLLNLFNDSNSTIGGAQILANDWDHMKLRNPAHDYVSRIENRNAGYDIATWSPCQFEGWPLETENGQVDADPNNPQPGDCGFTTRDNFVMYSDPAPENPKYHQDAPQPVCMVQHAGENETLWVSQDFHRKHSLDLSPDQCLNPPDLSGYDFNPNECLIRFLPGADHAVLGKIEPQKSWSQTKTDSNTSEGLVTQHNNLLLMEVNKRIAPGTTFNCRLRARFTNCADCYEDPDTGEEYADHDMAGARPFKLINLKFTVTQ